MKEFWDERYASEDWVYGKEPNLFFKEQLDKLKPGKILLPAEGEGRNGVYAARTGWEVFAFDQSISGKAKAEKLAKESGVAIEYAVGEFMDHTYPEASFDCIGIIYFHLPPALKQLYMGKLDAYLKPGGTIILECFSKEHYAFRSKNAQAGGPGDPSLLYSMKEIEGFFKGYEHIHSGVFEVELNEGEFHSGMSSVIRFVGRKPF